MCDLLHTLLKVKVLHFVHKLTPALLVFTWPFVGWVRTNARQVDIVSWIGRVNQAWSGRGKEGGVVSSFVVVFPIDAACVYKLFVIYIIIVK